ncbi:MAG: tetratricopeptide repeat protein [Actinomycetota bacterium]
MNPFVAALTVAALAAVAAAGVTAGFRRRDPLAIEPLADPLEDRRVALLRSLADLEEAHASGVLEDSDYRRLRGDTEGRIARLHRAIDGRRSPRPAVAAEGGAVDLDVEAPGPAGRTQGRVPPWAVAILLASTVLAVAVTGLLREAEPAAVDSAPAVSDDDPFGFFEQRVLDHPNDLAARLDLAHRYLDADRVEEALAEYAVALELDPDDAEAHAHIGLILYASHQPEEALESVDRALETAPGYPEALFIRGAILLRGLDRPEEAIEDFEAYLAAAPFGQERGTAQQLIAEAEAALAEPPAET